MAENIQSILLPLLIISYTFGLKIIKSSIHYQKYFSLLYMLFLWSIYYFLLRYIVMSYITVYNIIYHICFCADILTMLLSVAVGVYHNKKFRNCLKKLIIVDDTLQKLGMTTNYHKLYIKTIWLVLSWIVIVIIVTYVEILWLQSQYDYNIITAIYISCVINYCSHLNFISNLIFTTILGYIKLKFDQINELLWNLIRKQRTIIWKNPISHSHQRKFPRISNSKWQTCVLMHLHLELCKISRELDSIFGIEMTVSVGSYLCWLGYLLYELLNIILINDYMKNGKVYAILIITWCLLFICKLLFINYVCEEISTKASATGDLINRISYSNYDVDNESISQFLLQIAQAPLKFCGLGLFQFGYKVFHNFSKYTVTFVVILVQMHMSK